MQKFIKQLHLCSRRIFFNQTNYISRSTEEIKHHDVLTFSCTIFGAHIKPSINYTKTDVYFIISACGSKSFIAHPANTRITKSGGGLCRDSASISARTPRHCFLFAYGFIKLPCNNKPARKANERESCTVNKQRPTFLGSLIK